jgi:hypothetical protein
MRGGKRAVTKSDNINFQFSIISSRKTRFHGRRNKGLPECIAVRALRQASSASSLFDAEPVSSI